MTEARKFWEIAEVANDGVHTSQAVSNAIHAAIAAVDAVCLHRRHKRTAGEPHTAAGAALRDALKGTKWEAGAAEKARQLVQVIGLKNDAEYRGGPIRADAADRALKQVGRIMEFVERVLPPHADEDGD